MTNDLNPAGVEAAVAFLREKATRAEAAETRLAAVEAERDEARREATRLLISFVNEHCDPVAEWAPLPDLMGVLTQISNAVTVTRDIKARADAAEAQLAHAREVLEQVLSVEQCPHPIGDLVNDPDPSAKKCWESGACGCAYGAGFAAIRALGGGK